MSKIGIFGGSFNPIHNGHINLAKQLYHCLGLDVMLIIPVFLPPHKSSEDFVLSAHRFNMVKIATENIGGFVPCDIEIVKESPSYTIETVNQLRKIYPNDELYLIMGSDMFVTFKEWNNYKEILENVTICVGSRDKKDKKALNLAKKELQTEGAKVIICDIDIIELSSTEIRR
ncbi:MAG: nicotinate (nicotinamide) nucleotide adenylyltransferase, partial [Oscillospiraceae bacterium]